MARTITNLLGGGLRPNDPRRFLIEAMIGAMNADGVVDPREVAEIQKQIGEHPLFAGLGAPAARTLIDLSNDAIVFAGNAAARAPAIARGLPARIHRLAAYGMAAEVAAADDQLAAGEIDFLEALRIAMRISSSEADGIVAAARAHLLPALLDERYLGVKAMIAVACEVFAVRAFARGAGDDHPARVRDFFSAIPDLALTKDELDAELYRAFRRPRPRDAQVFSELTRAAQQLPDPADRYWMVVYALAAELPATVPSWRVIPFIGVLHAAFEIAETDMKLAVVDALTFPAAMPRPG